MIVSEGGIIGMYSQELLDSLRASDTHFEYLKGIGFSGPRILAVGCGGAGCNTVNVMSQLGIVGAETVAINTDAQHLCTVEADRRILIGRQLTRGHGAGGDPEVGRRAADAEKSDLKEALRGADLVFLTAGLGGGTGTGAAPVVAEIARDMVAMVVGIVTTPFHVERSRLISAESGVQALRASADTLIVIDNNRLLRFAPHLPLQRAFSVMDNIISQTIMGISETIAQPSLINLDYSDVKTIMRSGGPSIILFCQEDLSQGAERIVKSALISPLIDVDYRGATGCLLHVIGGSDMTLKEASSIAIALTKELDQQANVIWGARVHPDMKGRARLAAIITGVRSPAVLSREDGSQTMASGSRTPAQIDFIRVRS